MTLRRVVSFVALFLVLIFYQTRCITCISFVRRKSYHYESHATRHTYLTHNVNSNTAMNGQFPWMVAIHQMRGNYKIQICGGTVISIRWVLTAGHCIAKKPRKFLVVFGDVDRSNIGYGTYHGKGVAMISTIGVIHPYYETTVNDVALLYMPRDIPFSATIQPLKLAGNYDKYDSFAGYMGLIFGWGLDGVTDKHQTYLKFGHIPIITNDECSRNWDIPDSTMCTAAGTGVDACQGDSGGPLIVYKNNQYIQIGIVSYGDTDCPSTQPGVFTRITSFYEWIEDITGLIF